MNDKPTFDQDEELQDFGTPDDMQDFSDYSDDTLAEDDVQANDAEFYDLDGLDDADVFEDTNAVPAAASKKKPNWFNIGVAGVAILVAGGLILSKLLPSMGAGHSGNTMVVSQPAVQQEGQSSEVSVQAALAPLQVDAIPMGGLLDNPDAFSNLAQSAMAPDNVKPDVDNDPFAALSGPIHDAPVSDTQVGDVSDGLPMPSPISSEAEEVVISGALPAVNAPVQDDFWSGFDSSVVTTPVTPVNPDVADVAVAAPVAQVQAVQPAQSAQPTQPAQPVAVAIAPVVNTAPVAAKTTAAEVSAPVVAPVDSNLRAEVVTLNERLNSLESKIDSALSAAAKIQTQSVQTTQAVAGEGVDLKRIESAISRLESRIDELGQAPRQNNVQVSVPARVAEEPSKTTKAASAPKVTKASTPKATSRQKAEDAPYKPKAQAASSWRLRGAQPGLAIIAQENGNVREVRAGDFVPGLGEITGVAQMNGKWVVQGTQGRISQ